MLTLAKSFFDKPKTNLEQHEPLLSTGNQMFKGRLTPALAGNETLFFSKYQDSRELNSIQDIALQYALSKNKKQASSLTEEEKKSSIKELQKQKLELDRLIYNGLL